MSIAPSTKPLAERLQIKRDRALATSGAPAALDAAIDGARADPAVADVVVRFCRASHEQPASFAFLKAARADAVLWLAYPKLTSPLAGDLSRDSIRVAARMNGLDPVAQIAIDSDWSALRLKRMDAATS